MLSLANQYEHRAVSEPQMAASSEAVKFLQTADVHLPFVPMQFPQPPARPGNFTIM